MFVVFANVLYIWYRLKVYGSFWSVSLLNDMLPFPGAHYILIRILIFVVVSGRCMYVHTCVNRGGNQAQGSVIWTPVGSWFGMCEWVAVLHVCLFTLIARTHQCALVPAIKRAACADLQCQFVHTMHACMLAVKCCYLSCIIVLYCAAYAFMYACTFMPLTSS
jgi:hypothetical protein